MVIRTVTSLRELASVREFWKECQDHPNSDYGHFGLVCQLRREVLHPYVVVVEHCGKPCTLLVGRLERSHVCASIGYIEVLRVPATLLNVTHGGLLGEINDEIGVHLAHHIRSLVASGQVDAAVLHQFRHDTPLVRALLSDEQRG